MERFEHLLLVHHLLTEHLPAFEPLHLAHDEFRKETRYRIHGSVDLDGPPLDITAGEFMKIEVHDTMLTMFVMTVFTVVLAVLAHPAFVLPTPFTTLVFPAFTLLLLGHVPIATPILAADAGLRPKLGPNAASSASRALMRAWSESFVDSWSDVA